MAEKTVPQTKIKKTRGQVSHHPTALTAPSDTTGMEGYVKPMCSLYAFSSELAVTHSDGTVANLTVSVVAR